MTVGEAARRAGVSAKALRTWERAGLMPPAPRGGAGYRVYGEADLGTVRFIAAARRLGFGMARIRGLLALWQDRARPSAEVKRLALDQAAELRREASALLSMAGALDGLAATCHGDERPDCPILDGLDAGNVLSHGGSPPSRAGR
ncbi:MAG: MerR family transcriptional regulator [Acetobacteraceae bacterium]|nr:MerR family transcriptional regulator [Acetobacteraceae bacterium]